MGILGAACILSGVVLKLSGQDEIRNAAELYNKDIRSRKAAGK
jgi:hypothetical protein